MAEQLEDSFISTLLRLIQRMRPRKKEENNENKEHGIFGALNDESKEALKRKVPALAMANEDPTNRMMEELESLIPKWKEEVLNPDEPLSESVKALSPNESLPTKRRRSHSSDSDDNRRRRARGERRDRDSRRHRSRSPDRHKDERRRRSRERRRSRDRNDRRRRSCSRDRGRRRRTSPELAEKVEEGKIYDATICNITNFGAFAQIHGVRNRVEGECFLTLSCSTFTLLKVSFTSAS